MPHLGAAGGKAMGLAEILGVAGSISLLSGWRLYLTILATGVAMHFGWLPLPEHLQALQILANPWVMGVAAVGTLAEFLADKIAWVDSIWDSVHGIVRPLGGALLTLALVDSADPAWQVIAFILGGGGALISHSAKATTRAVVNISPEPYSNAAVSTGEDVATTGLLALVIAFPAVAIVITLLLLIAAVLVIIALRKLLRSVRGGLKRALGDPADAPPPIV
ncbi:DUF4126 domain-containing protein [Sphingopyxis sp. P1IMeth2]|uniref:DUF4126 domain-containing protein n=1 Tax=unclassified Sphingopyxis TaxID=2614943 RepID=UPI0021B37993|nr:DUF4126 domain-containing protein [Sphingopyxis sp. P1IMeth2]